LVFGLAVSAVLLTAQAAPAPEQPIMLPNGWQLSPAGVQLRFEGLPLRMLAIPHQPYLLALSTGYGEHYVATVERRRRQEVSRVRIPQGWYGMALSPQADRVYVGGGGDDLIHVFRIDSGKLTPDHRISLEARSFPAGMTVSADGRRLFVAAQAANALKVVDLDTRRVVSSIPVGAKPYQVVVNREEDTAWVSNWGENTVSVVSLKELHGFARVKVGDKPNDMVLTREGDRLFVANGNANSVSVIRTGTREVTEEIDVGPKPDAPIGSTPNALALGEAGTRLYVANADNNTVAVVDVSKPDKSRPLGLIPVGWYPVSLVVDEAYSQLVVANAKGSGSTPNAKTWSDQVAIQNNPGYVGNLLPASLSFIPLPDAGQLAQYTRQAKVNSPFSTPRKPAPAPFPLGRKGPVEYVVYIIKENRTYDSIFGDLKEGNGDPSYCLFPEPVTPNHHALAREFVLLDNTFHDAEVSADGHFWVTAAYATDYVEKLWPAMYGGKGRNARLDMHDDPVAYPASGFLWDLCKRFNVSYRSYGEGARLRFATPGQVRASTPSLEGHIHPRYYGADGIVQMSDRRRLELWLEEFREFERTGKLPRLSILSLPGDHLLGTRPGVQTPRAMMAENDFALGKIVEALTSSRFWPKMAIFVVEDDTQGAPDHVDVHRAPVLVISPYVKRRFVDQTMYSTSSVVRTIELLLGLPAMTQFDAAATPMWNSFQQRPDLGPYRALPPRVPLDEVNPANAYGARESQEMTLEVADTSDDRTYNRILWKAIKGVDAELPPRRVSALRLR